MVQLARLADERWASKPSFMDRPRQGTTQTMPVPATKLKHPGADTHDASQTGDPARHRVGHAAAGPTGVLGSAGKTEGKNPWDINRGAPDEQWQPESWNPRAAPGDR